MEIRTKLIVILALCFAIFVAPLSGTLAITSEDFDGDGEIKETTQDDLYAAASDKLSIEGNVLGDLFAVGGKILIDGRIDSDTYVVAGDIQIDKPIRGNVFIATGRAHINSDIGGNVYIAGGDIDIDGNVNGDVLIFGGMITINGQVADDVRVFGGTVDIDGNVGGDVMANASSFTLNGTVTGDVYSQSKNIKINSAYIGGDLTTREGVDLDLDNSTQILGEQIFEASDNGISSTDISEGVIGVGIFGLFWSITQIFGTLLLGVFVLYFAPVKSASSIERLSSPEEAMKSFGIGFLTILVAIFFVGPILFFSLVGWKLLFVLMALGFIISQLAGIYVGTKLGHKIIGLGDYKNNYIAMAVGVIVLRLLYLIPYIGMIASIFVSFIGIGAIVRMHYFRFSKAREIKAALNKAPKKSVIKVPKKK